MKVDVTMHAKLVRDRIPEIMLGVGITPRTRIAPREERLSWLLAKLHEESAELVGTPCIEECADVLEVVLAIANELGYDEGQLRQIAADKAVQRGGFGRGILLEIGEGKK